MNEQSINFLLQRSAETKGSSPLFSDEFEQWSGTDSLAAVHSLAAGLARLGITRQDRVAFLCDSSARHALVFFACHHLGAIPCALHVRSTAENIARALDWLDARILVIDGNYRKLAAEAMLTTGPGIPVVILDEATGAGITTNFDQLITGPGTATPVAATDIDAAAMIILSSGTTGDPKGIVHSQRTLYESAMSGQTVFGDISPDDSVLVAMSPSFAAWNHVCLPYLAGSAHIVFNHGFDAKLYIETLRKRSITHAALVPTAWRRVLALVKPDLELASLEQLFFSGEAATTEFISTVQDKLPRVRIRSAYLSSEGGDASACVADHELLTGAQPSVGKPVAGARVRIIAPDGGIDNVLEDGETGEIAVASKSLALGYWKNDSLSAERFVAGWWRSGDLGFIDHEGNLCIGGRNDNMIISGGLKVHAEEVEAALMQHPAVTLAAVVGVPDAQWGQRIEAFLVCDRDLEPGDILEWCRAEKLLASYKLPKHIHFREQLPTGATGKIYRRGLLEA